MQSEDTTAKPDWAKAHEVALALLCLCESDRREHLRVRPRIPSLFLEAFEEEGWIEDANTTLGWVCLTDAGWERARGLLRAHFGIVVEPRAIEEPLDDSRTADV